MHPAIFFGASCVCTFLFIIAVGTAFLMMRKKKSASVDSPALAPATPEMSSFDGPEDHGDSSPAAIPAATAEPEEAAESQDTSEADAPDAPPPAAESGDVPVLDADPAAVADAPMAPDAPETGAPPPPPDTVTPGGPPLEAAPEAASEDAATDDEDNATVGGGDLPPPLVADEETEHSPADADLSGDTEAMPQSTETKESIPHGESTTTSNEGQVPDPSLADGTIPTMPMTPLNLDDVDPESPTVIMPRHPVDSEDD